MAWRYDLNQIPYDYTVEVRNRFKGLDLIDRVPDELWNEVRAYPHTPPPSAWAVGPQGHGIALGMALSPLCL